MHISKLLQSLLMPYMPLGIVESGGGGSSDDEREDDAPDGEEVAADGDGDQASESEAEATAEEGEEPEEEATGELQVTIGDEVAEEQDTARAPEWVRELRKQNRDKDRRIRELEAKVAQAAPAAPVALGEKPTLESCDYDSDKFERDLEAWHDRKRQVERVESERREREQREQSAWKARIDSFNEAAGKLKVSDFEDAKAVVEDTLSVVQQGVLLKGCQRPELVVYALGKNPKKARELAAISDPVDFAFSLSKLEDKLKVTPRRSAPAPETRVNTSGRGAGAVIVTNKKLEEIKERCRKNGGDYTPYFEAKRKATA